MPRTHVLHVMQAAVEYSGYRATETCRCLFTNYRDCKTETVRQRQARATACVLCAAQRLMQVLRTRAGISGTCAYTSDMQLWDVLHSTVWYMTLAQLR